MDLNHTRNKIKYHSDILRHGVLKKIQTFLVISSVKLYSMQTPTFQTVNTGPIYDTIFNTKCIISPVQIHFTAHSWFPLISLGWFSMDFSNLILLLIFHILSVYPQGIYRFTHQPHEYLMFLISLVLVILNIWYAFIIKSFVMSLLSYIMHYYLPRPLLQGNHFSLWLLLCIIPLNQFLPTVTPPPS